MYATRPLSLYRNFPTARSAPPPGAPYSGYLVVTDEEAEAQERFCCRLCKNKRITDLPFPQDKILKVVHSSDYEDASVTKVWFIPVLDQPLSSYRYYVIKAEGKRKGLAFTCSREDDIAGCCFRDVIADVKPIPFNHRDIYQQVEIHHHFNGTFYAISVAGDGFPPKFLRRRGWRVYTTSTSLHVRETQGLNASLQLQLPPFDFSIYYKCSPLVVVARWYCPFVFVKEEAKVDYQVRRSLLYEMTLQQWWEEIYSCENERNEGNTVTVNKRVQTEAVLVYGIEATKDDGHFHDDGFVWFRVNYHPFWRRGVGVGLSSAVVEKMRWVEERRGWGYGGGEREVRVERVEELRSGRQWKRFGCYVLVESFVLKRIDGLVLLSCKFRHCHRVQSKWE
ncbi:hypothetical protein RHSIM_Rhsim10G0065900 [Rhododendron simsii]|uniref:DUF1262 family protein n=1 Tax=Rhododendron simsii TaxID=118357 RepID=A0A834LAZ8_RHOSS|nr:hypothetical protein RHSIM_Rhsim10G0065900 [Rhododendron simsii]